MIAGRSLILKCVKTFGNNVTCIALGTKKQRNALHKTSRPGLRSSGGPFYLLEVGARLWALGDQEADYCVVLRVNRTLEGPTWRRFERALLLEGALWEILDLASGLYGFRGPESPGLALPRRLPALRVPRSSEGAPPMATSLRAPRGGRGARPSSGISLITKCVKRLETMSHV